MQFGELVREHLSMLAGHTQNYSVEAADVISAAQIRESPGNAVSVFKISIVDQDADIRCP